MSNEINEKLAKMFESFNDDCVFLSDSEAETYGITIWDYAQKHPDEVLNNYLNECLKCYEELVERIQACEDKIKDYTPTVAIPVDWIKKYIDNTLDEGNSQMLGFKAAIIKEMIEDWEKENGLLRD